MHWQYREPTLKDILSDSIVRAVMDADGVDPRELKIMLRRVSARMAPYDDQWTPWPADTSAS
jgi:hypothetical protein